MSKLVIGLIKDIISSIIIVAVIVGMGIVISGTWPFMVAVESGSMEPNLHKGDLVFLVSPDRARIVTWIEGRQNGYKSFGDYGDVIVYHPNGNPAKLVIHRVICWIDESTPMPNGEPAPNAGYITKGDHNKLADQPFLSMPVKKEWIVGVAKFRIPYLGWFKLVISGS